MKLMFVTLDGGGNAPPLLGIARACANRGHSVRVHGHARLADQVSRHGLAFQPFDSAMDWDSTREQSTVRWLRMFNERGIGRDLAAECAHRPPDLAVVGPASSAVSSNPLHRR